MRIPNLEPIPGDQDPRGSRLPTFFRNSGLKTMIIMAVGASILNSLVSGPSVIVTMGSTVLVLHGPYGEANPAVPPSLGSVVVSNLEGRFGAVRVQHASFAIWSLSAPASSKNRTSSSSLQGEQQFKDKKGNTQQGVYVFI